MLFLDLYVFTLKFLANKKKLKNENKNPPLDFLPFSYLTFPNAKMFSKKNFCPQKVDHNRPQTFFHVLARLPKPAHN